MFTSKRLPIFIISVLSLAVFFTVWTHRFYIVDTVRLIGYTAPAEIEELAEESSLSDEAKRLFYATHPEVLPEEEFDFACQFDELGLVLGCYVNNDIYILEVNEEQLEQVEAVTAAHEMLHVVYSRLGASEKSEIDNLLDKQLEQTENERILDSIDAYRDDPSSDIHNEMHSIFGTEYAELLPELEDHYTRYFDDRQKVLTASAEYEEVFVALEEAIKKFDQQLKDLSIAIDELEEDAIISANRIDSQRAELDRLLSSDDISGYNSLVAGFNQLVNSHNSRVELLQDKIEDYNKLVKERNSNAVTKNKLIKSLDSDLEIIN